MKKLVCLFALMLVCIGSAFAYSFEVDGIYYDMSGKNATVTYKTFSYNSYSGDVTIPAAVAYGGVTYNVTSIGYKAFSDCSGLTSVTIPNSVQSIGSEAFFYCSGLTSVTIPNSVTSIGYDAFYGCSGLRSIKVESGNGTYDSRDNCNAIIQTATNTLIKGCKNTIIPSSVTSIGDYAFSGCSGLTSITIPSSVTSIGDYAFSGCSGLPSVTIPNNVTSIGNYAFSSCSGLEIIAIPANVTSIGYNAFLGCKSLQIISVAKGNTHYTSDGNVLMDYDKTKVIKCGVAKTGTYVIPNSVTSIGDYAFRDCSGLTSVTIGNSVQSIGIYAFYGCSGLTSVTIGSGVESIENEAFYGCSGLTSITIPNSVQSIGSNAFNGCSGLTSVTIGSGVTSIGNHAFSSCSGLRSIKVESGNEKYDSRDNCNAIIETATNTLVEGCMNTTIPNSVTSIGSYAFQSCSGLTSITIPNSVESIGYNAFEYCSGLTSITIPNSVESIRGSSFRSCKGLTSVTIGGGVRSIGGNAFEGCSSLTSVTIPEGVTFIGDGAFLACRGLASVTIPSSVTIIGAWAFQDCDGLTSVTNKASVPQTINNQYTFTRHGTLHVLEGYKEVYASKSCWSLFTIVDDVPPVKVTAIELTQDIYTCEVGEISSAAVDTVLPADASNKAVTWSSQDPDIVCIGSSTGQLIGVQDGVTTITATANDGSGVTATAIVKVGAGDGTTYTITATPADAIMGSVTGSGTYGHGTEVTLTATPAYGYEFERWSDGSTANPYTFTATADKELTAYFQEEQLAPEADTDISRLDNVIYLEPASGACGQQMTLSVKMKNSADIQGYQFDLYLPLGVSVATDEEGFPLAEMSTARTTKAKTDYFGCDFQTSGALRVLCGSTKGYTFSGNDGEVCTITLNISEGLAEGDYPVILRTVTTTSNANEGYDTDYLKSTLTVYDYTLGDVNNDSKVNITDFTSTANYILGHEPAVFNRKAADFTGEGTINVTDLMSLANYILNGGPAQTRALVKASARRLAASAADNYIYIEPVTVNAGGQTTLSVKMKNTEAIQGFQCDIYLPEGINFAKDADGFVLAEMSTARTTTSKTDYFGFETQTDGALRLLCGSTKGYTFSGTDGEIARVTIDVPANAAAGTLPLVMRNLTVTSSSNVGYDTDLYESTLTVKAPQALTEVDFDFTDPASLGITPAAEIDDVVDITAPITKGAVTATVDGGVEVTIDADAYILEIDRGGALTLSTTAPSKIVKVEFGNDADTYIDKISATTGELDGFVWTGSEEEVVFEVADTRNAIADITTIKVWLEGSEAPAEDLTFTDGEAYTATAAKDYGKVTYTRTFDNTNWQALYVPFSMDYEEWSEKYDIAEINNFVEYDDDDNGVYDRTYLVVLKKTSGSTEPNYPYLIRAKETGKHSLVLQNKTLEAAESHSIDCRSVKNEYTFTGTYTTVTDMYANGYYALNGGHLQQPASASVTLSPQRWYMAVTSRTGGSSVKAQTIRILVDGEDDVEGICKFGNSEISKLGNVGFDLTGRAVSTATNVRGITISNGKKVIR